MRQYSRQKGESSAPVSELFHASPSLSLTLEAVSPSENHDQLCSSLLCHLIHRENNLSTRGGKIKSARCLLIVTGFAKRDHIPHFMKVEIEVVT